MKLDYVRRKVETDGVIEANKFSIELNSATVDILSSKIYTDNYLAVVRELSCNGWDAHVAAGNADRPFEVHFPGSLKSEFRIRDYGTGMSHKDVMYLYTTYFGSDKRDSNSAIGGLGLGSKAPFSYTDAFTVRSYFNGKVRTYAIFRDSEGIPDCNLVSTDMTFDSNGIEVVVPVKQGDASKFTDVAHRALAWFPTMPKIFNAEVSPPEWELKTPTGGLLQDDGGRYGDARVCMGSVIYNISRLQIESHLPDSSLARILAGRSDFVLFANIGELAISASREELNYTDKTKDRLRDLFVQAADELTKEAEKLVLSEPRIAVRYYEAKKFPDAIRQIVRQTSAIEKPPGGSIKKCDSSTYSRKAGPEFLYTNEFTLGGEYHPKLILQDLANPPFRKIVNENEELQSDHKSIHGWRRKHSSSKQDVYILIAADNDFDTPEWLDFLDQFDHDYVFRMSDYYTRESKAKVQRQKGSYVTRKRKLYFASQLQNCRRPDDWSYEEGYSFAELDNGKHILVGFNSGEPCIHALQTEPANLSYDHKTLSRLLTKDDETFVGVPRAQWGVAQKTQIMQFPVWLQRRAIEARFHIKEREWVWALHSDRIFNTVANNRSRTMRRLLWRFVDNWHVWQQYSPDSLLHHITKQFHPMLDKTREYEDLAARINHLEAYFGKPMFDLKSVDFTKYTREITGAEDWIRWCYPDLVEHINKSSWHSTDEVDAMVVNLNDRINNNEC